MRTSDLARGVFERPLPDEPEYVQADLTDAGDAFAIVRGVDAVVHAGAIPDPTKNPPHVVFENNLMATFNVLEASIRLGVGRFVYISSETIPGFFFPERPSLPDYVPVDEEHTIRPQDPYALSKWFGELLMDAAVARSEIRCISLRPSWVQNEYELRAQPRAAGSRPRCPEPEPLELHGRPRPRGRDRSRDRVRPPRPRGLLHRRARQRRQPAARRPRPPLLRRGDRGPRALARGLVCDLMRQGRAVARLLAEPVVEGLPRRRGPRTPTRNLIELGRR